MRTAPALRSAGMPQIVARSTWGGDLRPKGPMPSEEVRFLLVHHTAEPNSSYAQGDVVRLLRGIYAYHTGPSKGWPDVAYNFFVDKFGTVYEGRTGSLAGPLRGSATGGNQGYSQLCCFIGDFSAAPPPPPALEAMYSLLAWLADRYHVDTSLGSTVTFTSLGSNKWPAGATVTVPTIAGHRDVSQTDCPGAACYALVRSTFPQEVTARRGAPTPSPAPPTTAAATTTAPATTTPSTTTTETTAPAVTDPPSTAPPTTTPPTTTTADLDARRTASDRPDTAGSSKAVPLLATIAVGGAGLAGVAAVSARRRSVAAAAGPDADETEIVTAAPGPTDTTASGTTTSEPDASGTHARGAGSGAGDGRSDRNRTDRRGGRSSTSRRVR